MSKQTIQHFFFTKEPPQDLDINSLKQQIEQYPYFQAPLFLYLKWLYHHQEQIFWEELERTSPQITDKKKLFYTIFSAEYKYFEENTGKKELPEDKTAALLNTFFSSGNSPEGESSIEDQILGGATVAVDYFSYLEKKTDTQSDVDSSPVPLKNQENIDAFILKSEKGESLKINTSAETEKSSNTLPISGNNSTTLANDQSLDDDVFFTETLAQIYIKQRKYTQAYKIISRLYLNYPEKNAYFADQIRFLERLMQNSSS